MKLDAIQIGERIRKIREENLNETRDEFAERCNITANHLGRLERGQFLLTTQLLNTISSISGETVDYILYGNIKNGDLSIRKKLENIIDNSSVEELRIYYRMISIIKESFEENKNAS